MKKPPRRKQDGATFFAKIELRNSPVIKAGRGRVSSFPTAHFLEALSQPACRLPRRVAPASLGVALLNY
jgi:hypothetical protein